MPTFRQVFTGNEPEDFPAPPLARRLEPGDVVEYEADEPISHSRLELVKESDGVGSELPPSGGSEPVVQSPDGEPAVGGG